MTLDIKRILVPVDFSANSELALHYASAVARKFDAALHLLHVCEVPAMTTGSMDAYAVAQTDWRQQLADEAERQLLVLRKGLPDIHVSTEVLFGKPARCIVRAAVMAPTDLIIMGTHGRGPIMHLLMGNVAERVVRTAPCPVLTVPEARLAVREAEQEKKVASGLATAMCAIGAVVLAMLVPAPASAQDAAHKMTAAGGELFRTYCAVCHGSAARGDGPLASSMTRKPADLTEIAKRNGGTYPSELVFRTIDGKKPVRGHGGPDMPVWGDAFARSRDGGDDATVRRMIQSLVDYLESIQARPGH
jgi:nucleotide-binding universal stress UspA family protein/mono/diheme cytochrome c family protein